MRRLVAFALLGMVAAWFVSFLPPEASTLAIVLVIGIGAGGGIAATRGREVLGLATGAIIGTAWSGVTQAFEPGGPDAAAIANGAATVGLIVFVTGAVAFVVADVRRPQPPVERVGDDADAELADDDADADLADDDVATDPATNGRR
ncbi:MAG TPA: hypothetical protein VFX65_02055 [Candidatus Limnocylindrales bacterium]|nr:hypothetical protein [Candidatus Limnocylindrales bacterium]